MIRTALKTIFAHKLRLTLTALSVVLGVGFIAGTFIFTDTIDNTFSDLFEDVFQGQDVIVQGESEFDVGFSGPPPMAESVLETVRAVSGVEAAEGSVGGFAVISDKNGDAIVPTGPPTLGGSWTDDPRLAGNIALRDGREPRGSGEVTVDAATAEDNDLAVGDVVQIQTPNGVSDYEIVGVVGFGESDNLAGATFAGFDLATAQELFDLQGQYSTIVVLAEDGVSPDLLRTAIAQESQPQESDNGAADEKPAALQKVGPHHSFQACARQYHRRGGHPFGQTRVLQRHPLRIRRHE